MKISIKKDHFEQAVTPDALKSAVREFDGHGFYVDDHEDLVAYLSPKDDLADKIDDLFASCATNADVFFEIEQAARCMIGAGFDLIRIIELWRGRHFLGNGATLIERDGGPKIGIMAETDQRVTVIYSGSCASELAGEANPNVIAQRLLRAL